MNNQEYSTIIINAGDEEFELSDIALERYLQILVGKYQVAEEEEQKIIAKTQNWKFHFRKIILHKWQQAWEK